MHAASPWPVVACREKTARRRVRIASNRGLPSYDSSSTSGLSTRVLEESEGCSFIQGRWHSAWTGTPYSSIPASFGETGWPHFQQFSGCFGITVLGYATGNARVCSVLDTWILWIFWDRSFEGYDLRLKGFFGQSNVLLKGRAEFWDNALNL